MTRRMRNTICVTQIQEKSSRTIVWQKTIYLAITVIIIYEHYRELSKTTRIAKLRENKNMIVITVDGLLMIKSVVLVIVGKR